MRQSVCVDLDGTLAEHLTWQGYAVIGDPLPGAAEFTKKLSETYEVIIHTCRCAADVVGKLNVPAAERAVRAWLDKHGFSYSYVHVGHGKPVGMAYVDDRAVCCQPQHDTNAYAAALRAVERMERLYG